MDVEKKKLTYLIVALVGLILIAAILLLLGGRKREAPTDSKIKSSEQTAVETLSETLDEAVTAPPVSVPTSRNPVRAAVPQVNPLEKTNPFRNEYENPFK